MAELQLASKCRKIIYDVLPPPKDIFTPSERFTIGEPDTRVTWNGRISFLEFKYLDPGQPITAKGVFRPGQLERDCHLERCSGQRAWVIAYRKPKRGHLEAQVEIYRPRLIFGDLTCPHAWSDRLDWPYVLSCLMTRPVAFPGHDHEKVAQLLYETMK